MTRIPARRCAAGVMLVLMAASLAAPLAAQDAEPKLEDLIPDAAVADPEGWAADPQSPPSVPSQAGDDGEAQAAATASGQLQADAPMADIPGLDVAWPDALELPPVERLEPEADAQLAAAPDNAPGEIAQRTEIEIGNQLVLAFPVDPARFPERDAVVARFRDLSSVRELAGNTESIAQLAARARADEKLLDDVLRVYGYYDAQVIRSIAGLRPGDPQAQDRQAKVRFDVDPGQRYRFGTIDLGALAEAPDYAELRATFGIAPGEPLSSDRILSQQYALDTALGESGYPFATIAEPALLIDHAERTGDLTLPVEPKGKYAFGEVTSSLPDFLSGKHLASIARFRPGQTYQRSLELDLRRAIIATGLVSSVTITPREVQPPSGDQPGTVALDVGLAKAPLRTVAGAIGYGSQEGFRLEASWEHRNLFPPEGALKLRAIVGTQEQLGGVTFRKNNFGGRDRILTLDAFVRQTDTDAYAARTVSLTGTYERVSTLLFQKPFSWGFGFELVASNEREVKARSAILPSDTYFVAALPVHALVDTSDSLLDPTQGYRIGGRLSPEVSNSSGQTSAYLRSQFDLSAYRPVGDRITLAARVRLGVIAGAPVQDIAPSRRLYAGGGGSVRGYGYQTIGPVDTLGDPNGGRSLVEASIEARIGTGLFDGALSVVPFVDAGTVSRDTLPSFGEIKLGVGVGVRYQTGFGPIRVDLGVPLQPGPNDGPVAVYVSLGQAF